MALLDTLQAPKTLPHSEESERAVLAGILLEPQVLPQIAGRLTEEDFYFERHQRIYGSMLELQMAGTLVDLRTLQGILEQKAALSGVGGLAYLAGLDVDLPDLGRIDSYVEIVKERSLRRRLIQACSDVTRACLDGGLAASEALGRAEQAVLSLGEEAISKGFVPLGRVLDATLEDLEENPGKNLTGVPTGFIDFDRMTHGLNKGNLIIIAGRPGMGKCVAADTELVEADGSLRTIEEIVATGQARLLTLDGDQRLRWTSPSAFVDDGQKPVFEVTTRLGRRVKVTAVHPFLSFEGWKPLAELAVGDAIAVPRRIAAFGQEPLGEHRARLLGYLLGDGGLTRNAVRFTNSDPRLRHDFAAAVAAFGGLRTSLSDSGGTRTATLSIAADEEATATARSRFAAALDREIADSGRPARALAAAIGVSPESITGWRDGRYVPSSAAAIALGSVFGNLAVPLEARHNERNSLVRWLDDLGLMGCGAHDKFVPDAVFRAPEDEVALFLNRLLATDGWVTTLASGQVQVGYCSCSERLARQVQHLLLRFGVVASLRQRVIRGAETSYAWQLDVTDACSIAIVIERIGIFGKERQCRRASEALRTRRRHSNRDLLPVAVWQLIDRERGPVSWAGDVYWDRIVSIRYVGIEQVYDLTIPETHNFVANDVCVHNTSIALNMAQHVATREGKPVGIFSLEMSQQELALRILCSEADVSFSRLRAGHLSQKQWQSIVQTVRKLGPSPLFIDDSPNPTLLEVGSKVRRLKAEVGLELVILDYLQLMQAGGKYENRNLEIAAISRGLKQLAKELELPVIALSQLSRQPERRGGDHRPQLADLRESGSIEQDADMVAFVYRDEIYNPEDPTKKGLAELIISKHRNGETGTVNLAFFGETTTFRNLAYDPMMGGGAG